MSTRNAVLASIVLAALTLALVAWNVSRQQTMCAPSSLGACPAASAFSAIDLPPHADYGKLIRRMEELANFYDSSQSAHARVLRRLYMIESATARSKLPAAMHTSECEIHSAAARSQCADGLPSVPVSPPAGLKAQGRVARHFETQVVVVISSRVLPGESLAFNRVRSQRFGSSDSGGGSAASPAGLAEELLRLPCHLPTSSDFCAPANLTMADDRVGYLTSHDAVAFANMGRLTALHGVVASRRFADPLHLTRSDVVGMVELCHRWFVRTKAAYPHQAQFPSLTFDLLRNGGASQTHPHMQPHLVASRYPGKWEAMRLAACEYAERWERSYFIDVASVHAHLGLVVRRTAHFVAFVALTSVGAGAQIDIVGDGRLTSGDAGAEDLARELGGIFHDVLDAAVSALGWEGSSASCAFPPMDSAVATRSRMPRVCRLVSRGRYGATVSDISANELFETPAVSVDLFEAADSMRKRIAETSGANTERRPAALRG